MKQNPKFFSDQELFRKWLRENHKTETELWVGYYKKATGIPSLTWSESVDQALCFGWIDGLRKSIDDKRYKIRFTPRRPTSNWSDVNIRKIAELKKKGLMREAGIAAWKKRSAEKSGGYNYENKPLKLSGDFLKLIKENKPAWEYFNNAAPGYTKQVVGWIMSAKKEETRLRRLSILIKHSAKNEKIP